MTAVKAARIGAYVWGLTPTATSTLAGRTATQFPRPLAEQLLLVEVGCQDNNSTGNRPTRSSRRPSDCVAVCVATPVARKTVV